MTNHEWLERNAQRSPDAPWHGWKLVGAWISAAVLSWTVVGLVAWALYLALMAWGASS